MVADDEPRADGVLRAAMGRRDGLDPRPRRRTQLITMTSAAGILVLGLAAATWLLVGGDDPVQPAAATPTTAAPAAAATPQAPAPWTPAQDLACPGPPPIGPVPVDGFGSPEVLTTPHPRLDRIRPGQLVVGWTDIDHNVLLARWPAATDPAGTEVSCDAVQLTVDSLTEVFGAAQTYDPDTTTFDEALDVLLASFDADAASLGVPGRSAAQVDDTVRFTGSREVDQLPTGAHPCPGDEEIPNDTGRPSDTPPTVTPEEAVASLLTRRSATWETSEGFTRLVDPEGSVVYGVPSPSTADAYLVVVWVAETPEGWVVDRWETSGC